MTTVSSHGENSFAACIGRESKCTDIVGSSYWSKGRVFDAVLLCPQVDAMCQSDCKCSAGIAVC